MSVCTGFYQPSPMLHPEAKSAIPYYRTGLRKSQGQELILR